MNSNVRTLPIQHTPEKPQIHRQHTVRYYAHRVKESLTTRISKLICAIFLTLLLFLGIISFILWLSLRPHRPRFHIHDFSIPTLAQADGFENAQIFFNVTVRNSNQHIGVYYDTMVSAVYYKDQKIGTKPLLFPFLQEPKTTTIINDVLSGATLAVSSSRWAEFMSDRSKATVPFRLEITANIRFKVSTWNSKHHRLHADCPVSVGADGTILATSKEKRCRVYFS